MSLPDIAYTSEKIALTTTFVTDYVPEGMHIYDKPTMTGEVSIEYTRPTDNRPGRIIVIGSCRYTSEAVRAIQKHDTVSRVGLKRALSSAVYKRTKCAICLERGSCDGVSGIEDRIISNKRGNRFGLDGATIRQQVNTGKNFNPNNAFCLRIPETTSSPG